ncbi:MAG: roadblock/LC7 domain-containing protein [Myxococcota bacterium]
MISTRADDLTFGGAVEPDPGSRTERLNGALRSLRMVSTDIIGAAVVTMDGFIVSSLLPAEVDEELIGGMAASILGVGERISEDLMRVEMEQVYVRSPKGYVVVNAINEDAAILLLVTREAKLGLIFLELKRAVRDLVRIMS